MEDSAILSSDSSATLAPLSADHRHVPAPLAHTLKGLLIVTAGFVAYQSLAPTQAPGSLNHMDKFVHGAVYCVLAFLMAGGWRRSTLIFVFIVTAVFGAALEAGQGLMQLGRTASLADQLANTIGAALGCGVWIIIGRLYRRNRTES